jgi:hypothetical protein
MVYLAMGKSDLASKDNARAAQLGYKPGAKDWLAKPLPVPK